MIRSSDGAARRDTAQLADNERGAHPGRPEDSTDSKSRALSALEPEVREPPGSTNALQESAYRLHALVKRDSPRKPTASPTRLNKTAPLPKLDISQPLSPPRKPDWGQSPRGISKAPPSPRRSPLRRDVNIDALTGTPQTRNVVERMIAYARHAASQEDPEQVRRDRQQFVTRLADRLGEPEELSSSPRFPTQSSGTYPIMTNLGMHANLAQRRRSSVAVPNASGPGASGPGASGPASGPVSGPNASGSSEPNTRMPDIIDARHTRPAQPEAALELHERKTGQARDDEGQEVSPVRGQEIQQRNTELTNADHAEQMYDEHPEPRETTDINDQRTDKRHVRASPQSKRIPPSTYTASMSQFARGQHEQRRDPSNEPANSEVTVPSTPQRTSTHRSQYSTIPFNEAPRTESTRTGSRAEPTQTRLQESTLHPETAMAPEPWDREQWRAFSKATRESFRASNFTAKDALSVFNELVVQLPPEMRSMSIQEMVHRLNAWIRSTAKLARR